MKSVLKYFFLYLLLLFGGAMVLSIPTLMILIGLQGTSGNLDEIATNPWLLSTLLFGGNLLVLLVFWKKRYSRFHFKINTGEKPFDYKKLYLGAAIACLGCLLLDYLSQFYIPFPDVEELDVLEDMSTNPLGFLTICLIGPMAEETVFRGAIVRSLLEKNWKPWLAIGVGALFFAVAHMNLAQGFTAIVIGILMGWVYYRTRNLWPCIFIHVLNNTAACGFSFVSEATFEKYSVIFLLVSVIMIYLGVMLIARMPKALVPPPISEVQPSIPVGETWNAPFEGTVNTGEPVDATGSDTTAEAGDDTQLLNS